MSDHDTKVTQRVGVDFQLPLWGFMRPVIDALFWFQSQHCRKAHESELLRLQYTAEFRAVRDIALTIKDH